MTDTNVKETNRQSGGRCRRSLPLIWTALAALLLCLGLCTVSVVQNDFDLVEHPVTFTAGGNRLAGVLATPSGGHGPFGLAVFVHGDGPSNAAGESSGVSYYRPIWEALAKAGYACLSWDKPGVGGSSGNWLHQTMDDRAVEVAAALAWARTRSDVDPSRIGLWGGSQAGWVMPRVVASTPGITFMIAVSVAINWQRQGTYLQLSKLNDRGASPARIEETLRSQVQLRDLVIRDANYQQYRAELGDHATMSADRWLFTKRNFAADATTDLRAMRGTRPKVLLVLAGHDRNVDVAETEQVYRAALEPSQIQVKQYPAAAHSMIRDDIERSQVKSTLTAVFAPRRMYAPGFLRDLRAFLSAPVHAA